MTTIQLTIDGIRVSTPPEHTIMQAAAELGVQIPGLCHLGGHEPWASCSVCVVEDVGSHRLLPACATRVEQGMEISTGGDRVHRSRRQALELLFSEHVGDCEAPCRLACPAGVRIDEALWEIELERPRLAVQILQEDLGLPGLVCSLCPAPCEKACRRVKLDGPIRIRGLWRQVLTQHHPGVKAERPDIGTVAVVGAGPAGLLSATRFFQLGYEVTIYHRAEQPGGSLRTAVAEDERLEQVLSNTISEITGLGVRLEGSTTVGTHVSWKKLLSKHDILILATGDAVVPAITDLQSPRSGRARIFATGTARAPMRRLAQVAVDARMVASKADRTLRGLPPNGVQNRRLVSRMGRLTLDEVVALAADRGRNQTGEAQTTDLAESSRCLQCGCSAADSCDLRRLAEEYGADPRHYHHTRRHEVHRSSLSGEILHEPGKCIRCGRCVRLAKKHGAPHGMAFFGRGADLRIMPPFNQSVERALGETADQCVEKCPTGALCDLRERRSGT